MHVPVPGCTSGGVACRRPFGHFPRSLGPGARHCLVTRSGRSSNRARQAVRHFTAGYRVHNISCAMALGRPFPVRTDFRANPDRGLSMRRPRRLSIRWPDRPRSERFSFGDRRDRRSLRALGSRETLPVNRSAAEGSNPRGLKRTGRSYRAWRRKLLGSAALGGDASHQRSVLDLLDEPRTPSDDSMNLLQTEHCQTKLSPKCRPRPQPSTRVPRFETYRHRTGRSHPWPLIAIEISFDSLALRIIKKD